MGSRHSLNPARTSFSQFGSDDMSLSSGKSAPRRTQTPRDSFQLSTLAPSEVAPDCRPRDDIEGQPTDNEDSYAENRHGGLQAWLQVLVGHLVLFNSFGLIQSFGLFQPYYEAHLSQSPFKVSWIGSIHIFLIYFFGTFSGKALDVGLYKHCLVLGVTFQLIGLFAAGASKSWAMSFAFHGVFQGIGHGLMFCPAITNTAMYFKRHKMTAMSIAGTGGATGGIVFPVIVRYSRDQVGISWTLWIIGFVVLLTSTAILTLAKEKTRNRNTEESSRSKRQIFEWKVFKEGPYAMYVIAMFLVFSGLWIPYFYIRDFTNNVLHISEQQSFVILLILNVSSIPGRIIPAMLAEYVLGTINTYIILLLFSSTTLFCWPLVATSTTMIPWAISYGFCAGGVASLMQAGIASLNSNPSKVGVKIGIGFSIVAFASLIGGPLGGELIKAGDMRRDTGEKYVFLQVFTGAMMLLGCCVLIGARLLRTGRVLQSKV